MNAAPKVRSASISPRIGQRSASKSSSRRTRRSTATAVAKVVAVSRPAEGSFSCWENRIGFIEQFRISRAESGFPVFQNVLELENDRARRKSGSRISRKPMHCARKWPISSCGTRRFRPNCRRRMAERLYLEQIGKGDIFSPFMLARDVQVSVNPKTMRPYYVVCWASFDGSAHAADGLYGDHRGFLGKDRRAAGDDGRQAQRQDGYSAAGRRAAQSGTGPPFRRFRPEEQRLFADAGRRSPPISTRISRNFIPSSCGASCSDRSIRPALPRTMRRSTTSCRRCARRKTPGC